MTSALVSQLLSTSHCIIWLAWLVYWVISAGNVKTKGRDESWANKLTHFGPLAVAVFLFWCPNVVPLLRDRPLPLSLVTFIVGTLLLVGGLLLTIWARIILGKNWSATVAVKTDHELIENGPYHWIRHPIYTGILVAFLGSAIAQDRWGSYFGVLLVFAGFWYKLLREEAWMRQAFGDRYDAYCRKTSRLLPWVL